MDRPEGIVDFEPDRNLSPFESRWFDTASHYLQEDEPELIAAAVAKAYGPNAA